MMKLVLAFVVMLSLTTASVAGTSVRRSKDEAQFRRWLTEYLDFEYHELIEAPYDSGDKKYWRYGYAMIDLNGDGKREAIVHVVGPGCGTGGCGLEVFAKRDVGWLPIVSATGWAPIMVLQSKSHGWADLGMCIRGGGVNPPYEAILRFDGKYYSSFVDKAVPRGVRGKVVISQPNIPLFGEKVEAGPPMSELFGPQEFRASGPAHC